MANGSDSILMMLLGSPTFWIWFVFISMFATGIALQVRYKGDQGSKGDLGLAFTIIGLVCCIVVLVVAKMMVEND